MASRHKPQTRPKRRAKVEAARTPSAPQFPVVGLGASAGGLAAFEGFFSGLPTGTLPNMAFVLVQHLAPDHQSLLSSLIKGFTHLEVLDVEDGMRVKPNCVYVIPPARDLALLNGKLQLLEPTAARGLRLPIDFFFRSLAQEKKELAIGVVLAGTGSDGAVGVRDIKGAGGMVMAQTPASTDFDGMPRSAIATGAVDFTLPPAEMAAQLVAYVAHHGPGAAVEPVPYTDSTTQSIMVLLRAQTGHDFSQYKTSTVHRRIERRMAVHQVRSIRDYLKYLQRTPTEVDALFRDLLIGVTSFFRDEVAWKAMEEEIPALCATMAEGSIVRCWVPGCSTGEEAYSLAMLLAEYFEASKRRLTAQIFATDIDGRAIAAARAGVFSASAVAGVSPQRLDRFFTAEPDGSAFHIRKSVREHLVFSEHDVVADPPFSRLDILSCRNVLIYMSAELQKSLIPRFYYALRPGGLLLLGTSEGVSDFDALFRPLDRKAKLYQRRSDKPARAHGRAMAAINAAEAAAPRKAPLVAKLSSKELFEQAMLRQLAPASALINGHGDILYLHGRSGMFLEPAPGDPSVSNIVKMAREGLRTTLSTALHRAVTRRETVRSEGLRVKTNGHFTLVDLLVVPVAESLTGALESPLFLVLLQEARETPSRRVLRPEALDPTTIDASVAALREELRIKDEQLQRTNEELVTSTEELKSSNEEMQSVNEELQSTNEELETSKEELQSVNEELAIVNAELQSKVADLSRANSDMNNLLAGTGIATVFVDHELKILRFTPAAREITNLIQGDVGRPVGHIATNLVNYSQLVADTQEVLTTLHSREVEVKTVSGKWYALRIQPYRTIENVIEGAVMSFLDITERVQAREALHQANEVLRLAVVVREARDALTVQDGQGHTIAWNPAAERLYGWTEAEALTMNVSDRIPAEDRAAESERTNRLRRGEAVPPYQSRRLTKSGDVVRVTITATALFDEPGATYAIATTERALE